MPGKHSDNKKLLKSARTAVQKGQLAKAIDFYRQLVEAAPWDVKLRNTLGDLLARLERNEEAVAEFKIAADRFAEEGFYARAVAVYQKILNLNEDDAETRLRMADLLAKQGLKAEARRNYLQIAEKYRQEEKVEQAADILAKMADLEPESVETRLESTEVPTTEEEPRPTPEARPRPAPRGPKVPSILELIKVREKQLVSRNQAVILLLVILAAALGLRAYGLGWGLPYGFHPDERMIVMTADKISAADPNPHFFGYGSFPIYLLKGFSILTGWVGLKGVSLTLLGRLLSVIMGTASVFLVFLLGRRLWSETTGLVAAGLMAVAVIHVQNCHYYTADVPLTLFVLFSLWSGICLVSTPSWWWAAAAGLGLGLGLATKISALPLVIPLLAAALMVPAAGKKKRYRFILAGVMIGTAAVAAIITQPYAVLDWPTFSRHILEQRSMVTGGSFFPYTLQFKGTIPYLYPLIQLIRWSLGFPIGVTAVAALTAAPFMKQVWDKRLWVLYAWVVPYVIINAGFYAKYPRYLLPAVPVLLVITAGVLMKMAVADRAVIRGGARAILVALGVFGIIYSIAFLNIYRLPNPRLAASDFIFTYFPAGSRVLVEHWDDRVPVTTSRGRAEDYLFEELPLYEPDTTEKWEAIAESLSRGDLILLASRRLVGSIPRDPERYPIASKYYPALLNGDLGYRTAAVFTTYPSLFGYTFRDDLADESIRVYDHPKVIILAKTESLTAGQILERLEQPSPGTAEWDLEKMISLPPHNPSRVAWDRGAGRLPDPSHPSPCWKQGWQTIAWLILIALAGPLAFSFLAPVLTTLPDRGWGFSRIAGPFLFGILIWVGAARGWWPFSAGVCWVMFVILTAASILIGRRTKTLELLKANQNLIRTEEAVFWGALVLFLLFKAFNPAVFWGEKPMNLSYLGALVGSEILPPPDPWLAGWPLNYYYLGHYLVALPTKMLAADPVVTFNLASATLPALIAIGVFSLLITLTGRRRWGLVGVAFTVVAGNAAALVHLIRLGSSQGWWNWTRWMNFDYFWAPSRVLPGTINEFPFWSFLFSDLHAHLLVMPVWVSILLIGWHLFKSLTDREGVLRLPTMVGLGYAGLAAVATYAINPWSLPGTIVFFLMVVVGGGIASGRKRLVAGYLLASVAALGLGVVIFLPYLTSFSSQVSGLIPVGRWTSPLIPFLLIWGYFLGILVVWLMGLAYPSRPIRKLGILLGAIAGLELIGKLVGYNPGALVLGLAGVGLAAVAAFREESPDNRRYALLLAGFGLMILAGCELMAVRGFMREPPYHRFNTVFKLHLQAWFPLAAAAAYALTEIKGRFSLKWGWKMAAKVVFWAATIIWFQFAITGTRGKLVDDKSVAGSLPTLDGLEYLRSRDPLEWQALSWLRKYADKGSVVLEASGPIYREYSRVTMYTGLPTLLGWDYHLVQQNHSPRLLESRKQGIQSLYSGASLGGDLNPAKEYDIRFFYVGSVERKDFGPRVEKVFDPFYPKVFHNARVSIYETVPSIIAARPREAMAKKRFPNFRVRPDDIFIGGRGQDPGQFLEPRGMSVTPEGDILVADFGNSRIQRFDLGGAFKKAYGRRGTEPTEMNDPCDVAVSDDGTIFLLDTWNHRLQVLNPEGKMIRILDGPPPGFYGPRGIALSDGLVAVADTGNHRVVLLDPKGSTIAVLGGFGDGPGQFLSPVGVVFDGPDLVVIDSGNNRLQVMDRRGTPVAVYPIPGWSGSGIKEGYITITPDGRYLMTDPIGGAIMVINAGTGESDRIVIPAEDPYPTGIAFWKPNTALVVETNYHRVVSVRIPPEK